MTCHGMESETLMNKHTFTAHIGVELAGGTELQQSIVKADFFNALVGDRLGNLEEQTVKHQ